MDHSAAHRFVSTLILFACGFCTVASELIAAETASIQTYNIRYLNRNDGEDVWSNRATTVAKTIQGADVVGLQEVVLGQFTELQTATPDMQWYGRGRDNGAEKGEMTPIGWRKDLFTAKDKGTFWLSEDPEAIGKKSWDAALPRIASWVRLVRTSDQRELLIVNTHFDHIGKEARLNSARLILQWIAENRGEVPVVLIGDLNAQRSEPPLMALLEPEKASDKVILTDALVVSKTKPLGPTGTWNGFKKIAENSRIDHVLVSTDVDVLTYETLDPRTPSGRFASDHLPIQITIEF